MSLKVVYVLVCRGAGRLAAMTHLSVLGLRRVHPEARAVLLCDPGTRAVLGDECPKLLDAFDQVRPYPSDYADPKIRSRHLKTVLRQAVDGDFVYLDIDTLPVRPFADIAAGDWDVAMVQDRNHLCPVEPTFPHWRVDEYVRLGWPQPLPRFFNSGVAFFRDSAATRRLGEAWQRRWAELFAIGREDDDQFALSTALYDVPGLKVHELDTTYNAMVRAHPVHARAARVYHYYAGNGGEIGDTLFDYLLRHFEATGAVDWGEVDRCVATDHPWMPPYWTKRIWQSGNRGWAIRHALLWPLRQLGIGEGEPGKRWDSAPARGGDGVRVAQVTGSAS